MKRLTLIFTAAVLLFSSISLNAQLGVYAGFNSSKLNRGANHWFYGPTLGAYYNVVQLPNITFGVDGRASFLGSNSSQGVTSGLFGPRVETHLPKVPLKAYVEGLMGVARVKGATDFGTPTATGFDYGVTGGVDLKLSRRLDWRVAEFTYTRMPNLSRGTDQRSISTEIVFRLPIRKWITIPR
jgi:hypothetical protein